MAWIYLAESAESHSPWHHGLNRLPTVKTIDTLKASCSIVCERAIYRARRSGMMCVPLEQKICPWCRISSTEDFPARISAWRGMVSAWQEAVADFIGKFTALSEKQIPISSSSKTSRRFEPVELSKWQDHLPPSGIIKSGMLYPRAKSARPSLANAGFFLPRPTAKHYGSNKGGSAGRTGKPRHSIHQLATLGLLPGHQRGALNREYLELVMGYPTRWTEIGAWATEWYRRKCERQS